MSKVSNSEVSKALMEIVWFFAKVDLDGTCCGDLTMPEFFALEKVVETPDCPVQEVGFKLGFTKSGATRVVNRLEKKGFVDKVRSHGDARVCCVLATESGRSTLSKVRTDYSIKLNDVLKKLSAESADQIRKALFDMAGSLNS